MTVKEMVNGCITRYISYGWQPIPVHFAVDDRCSCARGEYCHTPGKHPVLSNWQESVLTEKELLDIWEEQPHYNMGLVTGKRTNLVALDIDAGSGGYESLRELEEKHGLLPDTTTANTGGGGKHYLFTYPEGIVIPTKGNIMRGIDIRGEGGQIVAPPSYHMKAGKRYTWALGKTPIAIQPVPMPQWLITMIEEKETVWLGESKTATTAEDTYYENNRNNSLFALGRRMRVISDLSDGVISQAIHATNKEKCKPPLDDAEVDLLISSVLKKGGSHTITAKGEGGLPPSPIQFMTETELCDEVDKPIPYLVPNLIAEGEICLLASPTEAGKSMLAMGLSLSIASGKPAWGRGEPCRLGRVMYCTEEVNKRTIRNRFNKLARGLGISLRDVIKSGHLTIAHQQGLLLSLAKKPNIDALLLKAQEFKPDLVILDTLVSYFGASEQEADVLRAWYGAVPIAIRNLTGSAVMVQHHTRKNSKMQDGTFQKYSTLEDIDLNNEIRGTSDLGGVNERIFFIWKKGEVRNDFGPTVSINLRNTKAREGDKHEQLVLTVMDTDENTTVIMSEMGGKSKKHQEMEHLLRGFLRSSEVVTKPELASRYKISGVSQSAAYRWIDTFVDEGILRHDKTGYYLNLSTALVSV